MKSVITLLFFIAGMPAFVVVNIEFKENLELVGREKWNKVIKTNKLFTKYLE